MQSVIILLNEILGGVANGSRKMTNQETILIPNFSMFTKFRFSWQRQSKVAPIIVMDSTCEVLTVWLWQLGLLIQQTENTTSFRFN